MMARWHAFRKPCRVGAGLVLGLALGRGPSVAAERPGEGPPDLTPYQRPLVAEEMSRALAQPPAVPGAMLVDLVIAAGLGATDTLNDSETSIAIDPHDPDHISISAFSGSWGPFAPVWISSDGGTTWTKSFTVPLPPGTSGEIGCPCDQTLDYGRSSASLYGAFLDKRQGQDGDQDPQQTWTGDSGDPSSAAAWQWLVTAGAAGTTNHSTFSDQPWLMVNRDPGIATQDDVYVAYTDYAPDTPENHVAVSLGAVPPEFSASQDVIVGTSAGTGVIASAAIRIATNPKDGTVYAAWEDKAGLDLKSCARNIDYRLSRSSDHGQTWSLNGDSNGILVASHQSDEGRPDSSTSCSNHSDKFGTVNALLGGTEAVAVDPANGDVYYVYHNRDSRTHNNRLAITRLVSTAGGRLKVALTRFVTGQVQAALPAVAVAANGTVGVLFDTYDGMVSGYPQFTVHLAQSTNRGGSWLDQRIVTFLSSTTDTGFARQRVLGDYQQLKSVDNVFYAAFPANGSTAGRSISNIDPFFLKMPAAAAHR